MSGATNLAGEPVEPLRGRTVTYQARNVRELFRYLLSTKELALDAVMGEDHQVCCPFCKEPATLEQMIGGNKHWRCCEKYWLLRDPDDPKDWLVDEEETAEQKARAVEEDL